MFKCSSIVIIFILSFFSTSYAELPEEILSTPVIRVYLENKSDGLGHQAHTANIVRRLKEAGYSGWIEVVFSQESKHEKVTAVFPTYDYTKNYGRRDFYHRNGEDAYYLPMQDYVSQRNHEIQIDEKNKIRFIKIAAPIITRNPVTNFMDIEGKSVDFSLNPVPFTITGASDVVAHYKERQQGLVRDYLKTKYFIVIQPPTWGTSYLLTATGDVISLGIPMPLSTRDSHWTFSATEKNTELITQLEALKPSAHIIPFYADENRIIEILKNLIVATQNVRDKKTVIIPIFNRDVSVDELEKEIIDDRISKKEMHIYPKRLSLPDFIQQPQTQLFLKVI